MGNAYRITKYFISIRYVLADFLCSCQVCLLVFVRCSHVVYHLAVDLVVCCVQLLVSMKMSRFSLLKDLINMFPGTKRILYICAEHTQSIGDQEALVVMASSCLNIGGAWIRFNDQLYVPCCCINLDIYHCVCCEMLEFAGPYAFQILKSIIYTLSWRVQLMLMLQFKLCALSITFLGDHLCDTNHLRNIMLYKYECYG